MKQKHNYKIKNWIVGVGIVGGLVLGCKKTNHKEQIQKPTLEIKVEQINVIEKDFEDVNDVNEVSEDYMINYTANRVGVDPALLKAIRKAENGGPGFEFGIMHTKDYENDKGIIENGKFRHYKNEYEKQASWSAWTIKKNLGRYEKANTDEDFIDYLQKRYCPIGVKNDPKGLNKNWEKNVRYYYEKYKKD